MARVRGGEVFHVRLQDIADRLGNAGRVRVGFAEDATYKNGTSVPLIAAINEFGAPSRGQPPRPFFRRMIKAKQGEWPDAVAGLLRANNYDAHLTLVQTGATIAGQLQDSINSLFDPPLAEATIKKKGFDKPLIETSHMINSVVSDVD